MSCNVSLWGLPKIMLFSVFFKTSLSYQPGFQAVSTLGRRFSRLPSRLFWSSDFTVKFTISYFQFVKVATWNENSHTAYFEKKVLNKCRQPDRLPAWKNAYFSYSVSCYIVVLKKIHVIFQFYKVTLPHPNKLGNLKPRSIFRVLLRLQFINILWQVFSVIKVSFVARKCLKKITC